MGGPGAEVGKVSVRQVEKLGQGKPVAPSDAPKGQSRREGVTHQVGKSLESRRWP